MANPGARLVGLQRCVIVSYCDDHVGVVHVPSGTSEQVVADMRAWLKRRKRGVVDVVRVFQRKYSKPL